MGSLVFLIIPFVCDVRVVAREIILQNGSEELDAIKANIAESYQFDPFQATRSIDLQELVFEPVLLL